ncbi:MAG: zinc-ribbon and DUF3426 domain-containing protein [Burkholderiales bacterium]|nr:zinc-ribbon and DUF3426 domain-containing protein [Burkholderiales bacterium]
MAGLATRCPACDTVFRVVPDQLRVSEGWVRCGRCAEVFDASASLVDLETGQPRRVSMPPRAPDAAPSPTAAEFQQAFVHSRPAPEGTAAAAGDRDPPFENPEPASAPPPAPAPAAALSREPAPEPEDEPDISATDADDAEPSVDPADRPSFVRRAERAERWRRPGVRAALALAALVLLLTLGAQATYVYRDAIAAREPALRPLLAAACQPLACSVGAVRAIEKMAVDSSGLVRVEKSNLYRLSVTLHNRDDIELLLPAIDLALTDSQGKLLARRVLTSAELGAPRQTLAAGRELALQATLQAATDPVAGYTVELFYP